MPRQELGSWCERLVLPLLHLTYVAWLPLPLIWRARDPRFLAANGQLLWTTPRALARIGGFHAVHAELVDDVALCRTAKRAGLRVLFADGFALARCRMYRSAREVVAGFSKNLHEGVGGTLGVLGVVALYACAFVLPWCALGTTVGVVGAGAGLVLRLVLAARFRQPVWSALLHPVGVLVLCGIALNSVRWSISGTIRWKGRVYAARATRVTS